MKEVKDMTVREALEHLETVIDRISAKLDQVEEVMNRIEEEFIEDQTQG